MDAPDEQKNHDGALAGQCPHHAAPAEAETPTGAPSREERFRVNHNGVDEAARAQSISETVEPEGATAVLLVSHGSHSPSWRHMLLDVHREVDEQLLKLPGVAQVRSAFMEYTEPSIATQLKTFDEAGIAKVLVIPLLLTVSDHSFDDIPVICGQREDAEIAAELAEEQIEIYKPQAELEFAPLLDFTDLVEQNLARRIAEHVGSPEQLKSDEKTHGLVLIGYGSADFDDEWHEFFNKINSYAVENLGIDRSVHAWCGHLVSYSREPTSEAIEAILEEHDRAIVVPIFVAFDEMFHDKIMGRAAERCSAPDRVIYTHDSILPDPAVGSWIVRIASDLLTGASSEPPVNA